MYQEPPNHKWAALRLSGVNQPMIPTSPKGSHDRFRCFPIRVHMALKRAVSRVFQRMAMKAQQCMQTMAEWMRVSASGSMPKGYYRPPMTPQAVTCIEVALALNRPCWRGLRNSKGDFYLKMGDRHAL
jgi:hypothetical protein